MNLALPHRHSATFLSTHRYLPTLLKLVFALFFLGHDCGSLIFLTLGESALPVFRQPSSSPALTSRQREVGGELRLDGVGGYVQADGFCFQRLVWDMAAMVTGWRSHPGRQGQLW